MQSLALAAYGLALASGLVALGAFLFLYRAWRSPLVRSYLAYLLTALLSLAGTEIGLLSSYAGPSPDLRRWYYFLETITCALFAYSSPRFFLEFADLGFEGARKRAFIIASSIALVASPLTLAEGLGPGIPMLPPLFALLAFLVAMLYSQVRLILAYRGIKDRLGRIGVPALVAYDLVCVVAGFADSLISSKQLEAGCWPYGALFRPVIYLAWNLVSLGWAFRYEGEGAMARPASVEPDRGRARSFGLTERELELARRLAAGQANKEIAADLGLSPNTVRNHVHNIFEKTGARNRVELVRRLCGADEAGEAAIAEQTD